MNAQDLPAVQHYQQVIRGLRRSHRKGESAPHKPILLLTILDHFSAFPEQNIVPINEDFIWNFHHNWRKFYSGTAYKKSIIFPPLHHLDDGLFWELWDEQGKPVQRKSPFSSETAILRQPIFGSIDRIFFRLLRDHRLSRHFQKLILQTYFPYYEHNNYLFELAAQPILYDRVARARRDSDFRKVVLESYEYTCAISGLYTPPEHALIEAAHIVPHAKSFNNDLENGIALNRILHAAFDQGYFAISDNYRVLLHPTRYHKNASPHGIEQFAGQQIRLPRSAALPNPDFLRRHRVEFGFEG